ncbi:hypothetical protein [Methanopyrus kandleri]|uniref:Uncharacterized protein n=1 Tax=Methanopyrus kandleri (strain AV19 / DSM 6324 / JCM 9639 / NBRC 100938) TaxID=190192 RepID=Q8TUV9_METKA|nr:hypothetical protein [Methanopyrus kandleri]AAM02857.1 Uncharacterized protein MK1644 [Methanopyrus kandleri AV19]
MEERDEGDYVVVKCRECGHVIVRRKVGSAGLTTETLGIAVAAAVTATAIASTLV